MRSLTLQQSTQDVEVALNEMGTMVGKSCNLKNTGGADLCSPLSLND